jgi:serine/threonine protein phosphatase PrpC
MSAWEMFAASHPQTGRLVNEDSFLIGRGLYPLAAVADGAGAANLAARKALSLFSKLHGDTEKTAPAKLLEADTWRSWVKILDSSLLGAAQSTFCAFNVGDIQDAEGKRRTVAVGACVGDSRLYLLDRQGKLTLVTAEAKKARLGSGQAEAFTFRVDPLKSGDILMLLSDGAWTPLNMALLQRAVVTAAVKHFAEVPVSILNAVGKHGFADDSTAVVTRVR